MKILFVHQHLGEFGGAETNIHLSAEYLKSQGHTVSLLFRRTTQRDEPGWRRLFSACFPLRSNGDIEQTEAVLAELKPDLIYLHTLDDLDVLRVLIQSGIPVVCMVHDHSLYCLRQYKYNYFTRRICQRAASAYCIFPCLGTVVRNPNGKLPVKWASYTGKVAQMNLQKQCHAVIVYSEYQKQELLRNGFAADKIVTCAPLRVWADDGLTSSFSDRNLVLFAGQIIRGKGVDALLKALAQVRVPFEAVVLGDGNHRAYCQRLAARLGLGEKVRFAGYVLPAELKEYYLDASLFAFSSLWPEPFGLAGPEAMRYGLPVVAFDAGAVSEWLHDGENGWLVPWGNTKAFARRIEQLLQNKDLARELGQRARLSVQKLEIGRQLGRVENLFLHLVQPTKLQPICST
jgi:glycosyltransferase involved in cell wall biosynthesis